MTLYILGVALKDAAGSLEMGVDIPVEFILSPAPGWAEGMAANSTLMCAAVLTSKASYPRITLTLHALLNSRWLVLPLQGGIDLTPIKWRAVKAGSKIRR
jgi:hypothetical protein